MKAINNYILEKLHLHKDMNVDSDRRFINKWIDILERHYIDWVKDYENKRPHSPKTSDDKIQKELDELIKWLENHYRKVELWNFEYSTLPESFIKYLKDKNVL